MLLPVFLFSEVGRRLGFPQFLDERHIIHPYFFRCGRVLSGEVEGVRIVREEERFVVRQVVVLPEKAPDAFAAFRCAMVPLVALYLGKLVYQGLVDDKMRTAVCPRGFVRVGTEAFGQKTGHLEIRVAEQGRETVFGSHDLRQKRPVAVAHQQVGLLLFAQPADKGEGLLRMQRQVGCQDEGLSGHTFLQCLGGDASPRGKEPVQKNEFQCFHLNNRFRPGYKWRLLQ